MKSKILTAVFFILSLFILTSCVQTQEDKVSEFVKQNMKNPKSFELESIEPIDTTFLLSDPIENSIYVKRELYDMNERLKYLAEENMAEYMSNYNKRLDEINFKLKSEIDSLTNLKSTLLGSPQDSIVDITWQVRAYGTNSFNATILSTYIVKVKSDGEMTIKEL